MSKTKTVFEFTVYEDTWLRGGMSNDSCLLKGSDDYAGRMCCLGFCANQAGIPKKNLTDVGVVSDIVAKIPTKLLPLTISTGTRDAPENEIAHINDDARLTDSARKKELKKLFKQVGMVINFVKTKPKKAA